MLRLSVLILPLLAASCSSFTDFISSSTEQKRAAYKAHRALWKRSGAPSRYGRERSVQLLEGSKLGLSAKKLEVSGTLGMASLVTPDGYALTAAHVISGHSSIDTVLRMKTTRRAPVHAQWTDFTVRDRYGHLVSESKSVQLFSYHSSLQLVSPAQIAAGKIRVVKSFPGRDLALVKLPIRSAHWFTSLQAHPAPGAVVFASGNGATPYQGPSAGQVVAMKRRENAIKTIDTSIPLASGDSGGPAFDASGRLVGIISHVRASAWLPVLKIDHSSLRMIEPALLHRLIQEDRAPRR